jgi:hypothetical protein
VSERAAVNPMFELAIITRPPPGSTKAAATPPKVHIAFGGDVVLPGWKKQRRNPVFAMHAPFACPISRRASA